MTSIKRKHLVNTAQQLFYQFGLNATGIDYILAESGVAKKTLYNHFRSKEELIVATLKKRDAEFMAMLNESVSRLTNQQTCQPHFKPIMALFDAIAQWVVSDNFNGCMFINASAEYSDPDSAINAICRHHKIQVINYIEELLTESKQKNTSILAKQIAILIDGAIVNAHTCRDTNAPQHAKTVALILLDTTGC